MISTITVSSKMGAGFRTEIQCSHPFVIDQPKALGGTDKGPNPLEVYLASLSGCISALARIIAMQRGIDLRGVEVKIEGDLDEGFLMGQTKEGRAGFIEVRTCVKVDADMSEDEKKSYLEEIELRCPISDNMANKSTVEIEICDLEHA
ncbi:MAG: OsmC family protein [Salinivirgaceae bacterium]|nr:OsmC family protein [Salinivirgaceae bacterium]MDD4746870.1 OsmC family protein [Salinivirgaceae bacterium]